jgi:hypothetical protein
MSEAHALEAESRRPAARQFAALLIVTVATAIALGHVLRQPAFMTANDISRWCTVWSLLERGTYQIDECPWQTQTQDKVYSTSKWTGDTEGSRHYYSSKPALLSTLIAAVLYPARRLSGVPLDRTALQERAQRWTQKVDPDDPAKVKGVLEKPQDPVKWPAYIFYFKPVLILCNVIPFGIFLVLMARVLDRYAVSDWAWLFCLIAAAFGTYLLPFTQTLNNHTIAAFSAFFALYQFLRIWDERMRSGWRFVALGFFSGFAAANELPALALPALLTPLLVTRHFQKAVIYFFPAVAVPLAALVAGQYAAFGEFKLPYESFGTEEYLYEGSLWKTPLELDALNERPEPTAVYLFHMTFGHHGVFSLTPIFLFSAWGGVQLLSGGGRMLASVTWLSVLAIAGLSAWYFYDPAAWSTTGSLRPYLGPYGAALAAVVLAATFAVVRRASEPMVAIGWLTAVLTLVVLEFYIWNSKARNYGGSTQGLRWLFWLIPFWLLLLPRGVEAGQGRGGVRRLALAALAISGLSVGYAMRNPWSHPWILDMLEHLNLYPLTR